MISEDDIECYRVNYDKAGWEKVTDGWTKNNVVPGAIIAIDRLLNEIETMRDALKTYAECSDGCTCGAGWSHEAARDALK